jgi:hypothetical protein
LGRRSGDVSDQCRDIVPVGKADICMDWMYKGTYELHTSALLPILQALQRYQRVLGDRVLHSAVAEPAFRFLVALVLNLVF